MTPRPSSDPEGEPSLGEVRSPESLPGALGLYLLAVVGQACTLLSIDVQPFAVYQHLRPWSWVLSGGSLAVWGSLAQTIVIVAVAWQLRERLRISPVVQARTLIVVAALAGFSWAVPTASPSRFAGELVLAGTLALLSGLNLILAVVLLPDAVFARAVAWLDERITLQAGDIRMRRWDSRVPSVVALWVCVITAATSYVVTERVPHIDDSISYYFQAKYHASGHLFLPPPPDAASFAVDEVIIEPGKWYGYGLPGWPFILALGVRAGIPWLVNPILGGLLILVGHALLRRHYGRGNANATVLLLALSPWLIFMSAEFMPHPLTALLVLVAALAFDHALERRDRWPHWAVLAGIATGAIALTRPFEAPLLVAALGLTALVEGRLRQALPSATVMCLVALALGALVLPFNRAVTGRATYAPQMAWTDRRWGPGVDRLGFGPDIGIPAWRQIDPLPGHGPVDVVLNANKNAFMANVELFGWAPGSLVFVWLAVALGRWRRVDGLPLALVAVFVLGYSAWWFSGGPDLGPRYWYPLLVPLAALTVRGAQMIADRFEEIGSVSYPGARVAALIVAASLSAAVTMLPWRAMTKHYRYRGVGGQIRELATSRRFGHDLVFVRSGERSDYQSAFNLNPKTLDDRETIYALDAGPTNRAAVVAYFPDRRVWVIGRRDAGVRRETAFEVIEGPLAPGTVPP